MAKNNASNADSTNAAVYELNLACSLLKLLADECTDNQLLQNVIFSISDHVDRAKVHLHG